jgi:hypothetical protein
MERRQAKWTVEWEVDIKQAIAPYFVVLFWKSIEERT